MTFHFNLEATDEQLIASGLSPSVLKLSRRAYIRPGADVFDCQYANSITEAGYRVALHALIVNNPGRHVWFPVQYPMIGFVPEKK